MIISALRIAVHSVHLGLLRTASLLIPVPRRSEWLREWRTELWYVMRECSSEFTTSPRPMREAVAFCLGAYQDAFCLRKRSWQKHPPFSAAWGGAPLCLLVLATGLFASWGIALLSPGVRAEREMSRIRIYPWQLLQKHSGPDDRALNVIAEQGVKASLGRVRRYFDGFAYYWVTHEPISSKAAPKTQWIVAHASSDLFAVLQFPIRFTLRVPEGPDQLPRLVLSDETWKRDFGGDPRIAGTEVHVGSVNAKVGGVACADSRNLPGHVNAWLVDGNSEIGTDNAGFVVGHLTPYGYFQMGPRWVVSLLGIVLAFLALPGITCVAIGEYGSDSRKPPLTRRLRFWAFLTAKVSLLLPFVYLASLDLDCSFVQPSSHFTGYVQFSSSLLLSLFGLRWILRDQQRRCPVCLRRMAHPAEIGQPARTLLAWKGTELVCARGHALLHIPEIPTSWFGEQRWVCLDPSWQFLFARPGGTSSLL